MSPYSPGMFPAQRRRVSPGSGIDSPVAGRLDFSAAWGDDGPASRGTRSPTQSPPTTAARAPRTSRGVIPTQSPPTTAARAPRTSRGVIPAPAVAPLRLTVAGCGAGSGGSEPGAAPLGPPLYPHQSAAVAWMRECEERRGAERGGGALADGEGMGKATSVAAFVASSGRGRPTLVVAPVGRVAHWVAAVRAHGCTAVSHVGTRRAVWDTRRGVGGARLGDDGLPRALARLLTYEVVVTSHACVTAAEWRPMVATASASVRRRYPAWIPVPRGGGTDGSPSSAAGDDEALPPGYCSCLHSVAWGRVVVDEGHKALSGRPSKLQRCAAMAPAPCVLGLAGAGPSDCSSRAALGSSRAVC